LLEPEAVAAPQLTRQVGTSREFPKLWGAGAASNLGDGIWLVAAPLLAASLTDSAAHVAGATFVQRLPWLLFPLVSGTLADQFDRRRIMIMAALFRAVLVGALGAAVLFGWVSIPVLYAMLFLIAAGETLFDTSAQGILPDIVSKDALSRANARLMGARTVANQFVGPPLGGWLYAVSAAVPFLSGAAGLAIAATLLSWLRGPFPARHHSSATLAGIRTDIAEGIGWLWRQRLLRTVSVAMALLNLTLVAQVAIMVLFARDRLGLDAKGYGLLLTAYGVGGVLGGLVADRVLLVTGETAYLRIAIIVETLVPAALALSANALAAGVILVMFGLHAVVWGAVLTSVRQELTPHRLQGRVAGVQALLEYGTAAPGALLGGWLATRYGLTAPFWLGAITGLLLIPYVWSACSDSELALARAAIEPADA
jgi:MFS family permease